MAKLYVCTIENSGQKEVLFGNSDLKEVVGFIQSHIKETISFDEKMENVTNWLKPISELPNDSIEELYDILIANRILDGLLDDIDNPVKNIIWDYQIFEIEY